MGKEGSVKVIIALTILIWFVVGIVVGFSIAYNYYEPLLQEYNSTLYDCINLTKKCIIDLNQCVYGLEICLYQCYNETQAISNQIL